jgi:IclR family acetate operon transcriptional repressor
MIETPVGGRYTVGSVAKAVRLIDIVAAAPAQGLTISELTRQTGMSKSATYGLARTLLDAGYLHASEPGPRYSLGMAFVRLGDLAGRRLPLREIAAPVLAELSRDTGLTIRVAAVDDGYPIFVDRVDAVGAVRFHAPLGVRELPHTSAAGKAILSALPDEEVQRIAAECGLPTRTRKTITELPALRGDLAVARRRGYAIDDEEDFDGVFCVAAAFFDHTGGCAGALSATGIKLDLPGWRIEELGRLVRGKADELTALLGGRARQPEA